MADLVFLVFTTAQLFILAYIVDKVLADVIPIAFVAKAE